MVWSGLTGNGGFACVTLRVCLPRWRCKVHSSVLPWDEGYDTLLCTPHTPAASRQTPDTYLPFPASRQTTSSPIIISLTPAALITWRIT